MKRKSLLYQSKVEYGGWTINQVLGCTHGCKYPCYALSLAKRTGRVKTYDDWCHPEFVENALELLDDELRRLRGKIDSVHLCFTTDPFMWDAAATPLPTPPRTSSTCTSGMMATKWLETAIGSEWRTLLESQHRPMRPSIFVQTPAPSTSSSRSRSATPSLGWVTATAR